MNITRRIHRLLVAALVALATFSASAAHADIAPPPVVMHVVGQAGRVTAGEPDHATFELENVSDRDIEVFLYRAILREGTNFPLTIDRVEVEGRAASRTLTIPAGASATVTVYFALPRSLHGRSHWEIDLRLTQDGHGMTDARPATLDRSGARKLSAPKSSAEG